MEKKAPTKQDVIEKVVTNRRRLEQNLAILSPEEMLLPGVVGIWPVKDLLAHLAEWEGLYLDWLAAARRGQTPEVPGHGSTWRNLDPLNQWIYEKHCDRSLDEVLAYFRDTHQSFMKSLDALTDEELFTPGYYVFTKNARLESWFGAFAAHDRWAKTEIRRWMRERKK